MNQKHLLYITALLSLLLTLFAIASLRAGEQSRFPFGEPQTIAADQAVASLAVGDFNGNGRFDLAAFSGTFGGNASPLFHWYEAPTMTKHLLNADFFPDEIQQFPGAAAAADIDRDGDLDLVLGNARHPGGGEGEIIWLENPATPQAPTPTGDWIVHPVISFAENAGHMNDISLTDLDDDGKIDIIMRHLGNAETLRILFQDDAQTDQWTLRSIGDLPFREGMGTADLDSDGDPDILLNGYWLQTPANPRLDAFPQHVLDPFYTSQPNRGLNNSTKQAFGDLNGDGKIDVVLATAEGDNGWLAWYAQPENPTAEAWPRVRLQETTGMHTLELGDIDNDGDLDILAGRALSSRGIAIWENQQNGQTFLEHEINNRRSYTGRLFDVDGDGDLDLVSQEQCCRDNGDLYWMENLLEELPALPTPTPIPPELLTDRVYLPHLLRAE